MLANNTMTLRPRKSVSKLTSSGIAKTDKSIKSQLMSKSEAKSTNNFKKNDDSLSKSKFTGKEVQQRQSDQNECKQLHLEIDAKINGLNKDLQSIRGEIQSIGNEIRKKQEMSQAPKTISHTIAENYNIDKKIECMFGCIAAVINDTDILKNAFVSTAIDLDSKIKRIERKDESLEETLDVILHAINQPQRLAQLQARDTTNDTDDVTEYDLLANAVECIQQQVNKVNLMVMQDDEKIQKIDRQMHVLSAKFVRFSSQINELILDFNRERNAKIQPSKYIDEDAKNFMVRESSSCEQNKSSSHAVPSKRVHTQSKNTQGSMNGDTNICAYGTRSAGRVNLVHNKHAYSKHVKIHIRDANIVNIDTFADELKNDIGDTIGHSVIDKVHINKYTMINGIICEAIVIVVFRVPMGYQYLNEFMFPTNWQFFVYGMGQNYGRRHGTKRSNGNGNINNNKRKSTQSKYNSARGQHQ